MVKKHEFRDPVHSFIGVDAGERRVIDSRPVQRLRYIRQLATSHLVYPGATHTRFEHSLGAMEMAGRIYDTVTDPLRANGFLHRALPELRDKEQRSYWRRVVRMAGLCHDLGHLPFSHAAEHELLPSGWSHERLSYEIIRSDEMTEALLQMTPPVRSEDVARIAVGQKPWIDKILTPWETILSEIIGGDAFGADRMDYLLRDSLHAGVAYGRFDHHRLIGTLRILPWRSLDDEDTDKPMLGVEWGGIQSVEALLMTRYFMFAQVYFHKIRMIYDIHLIDFLKEWLPGGQFRPDIDDHLSLTDSEIIAAIRKAGYDVNMSGHSWAKRLAERKHFRVLDPGRPQDAGRNPQDAEAICRATQAEFGVDQVRAAHPLTKEGELDFPVLMENEDVVPSVAVSDVLSSLPVATPGYVYADEAIFDKAQKWLQKHRKQVISKQMKGKDEQ